MTTKPIRLALIGTGSIASAHLEGIRQSEYAHLVAAAEINQKALMDFAEKVGCAPYPSHHELLENAEIDGVIVCTPPSVHEEVCLDFLSSGVPVLCEKPLSTNSVSARRMVEAARENAVSLTMASKFRFVEDVTKAKAIVDSGILGEIILFENAFTSHVDMTNRWNSNPAISGGGVLIDNGTHSVDIIRYFLGPISDVQAVEGKRVQNLPVEDTVQMFVRSRDGVRGTIDLSWSINKELESFINIYGSEGVVRVGWKESRYRQTCSSEWVIFGHGYNKIDAFRRNIDNFCKSLLGEEMLLVTDADALASVEVIEAAYRSLETDKWVPVTNGCTDKTESNGVEVSGVVG